jgi:hypothetical protein
MKLIRTTAGTSPVRMVRGFAVRRAMANQLSEARPKPYASAHDNYWRWKRTVGSGQRVPAASSAVNRSLMHRATTAWFDVGAPSQSA